MKPFTDRNISALTRWLDSQQEFVFLETSRITSENHQSLLFTKPVSWLTCHATDNHTAFLQELDDWRNRGYYLAGWIGYEFGYLLEPTLTRLLPATGASSDFTQSVAAMGVFNAPLVYDHRTGRFDKEFDQPPTQSSSTEQTEEVSIHDLTTNITKEEYLRSLATIKEYILSGDTYQVNFTFKLNFSHHGSPDLTYRTLRKNQSVSYSAWIRRQGMDIQSFSPELFFSSDNTTITVRPMKGTMARGRTLDEDALARNTLQGDLKNISENVMIVDLLRNDLGKLLHHVGGGSVTTKSLFDIETFETLLQMTSTIVGTPRHPEKITLSRIIKALFPCGSVTGAPKIRTMEIIHETEKEPRGVYCGAIGYSGPDKTVFNVPIRTLTLRGNSGSMGIGSGIVHDSDPESEWQESLLKGNFLTNPRTDFQLIETLFWSKTTGYWLRDLHTERLIDSARYFLFHHDPDAIRAALDQEVHLLERKIGCFRIRLLLHQDGALEVTSTPVDFTPNTDPTPVPTISPFPTIILSRHITDPGDPFLFHKTTRREHYTLEREQALSKGHCEVIFQNSRHEITEGSISNLFIRNQSLFETPPVSAGLLAGTFRRHLLETGMAKERTLTLEDLRNAKEIFIGNSVRGLVRVQLND